MELPRELAMDRGDLGNVLLEDVHAELLDALELGEGFGNDVLEVPAQRKRMKGNGRTNDSTQSRGGRK